MMQKNWSSRKWIAMVVGVIFSMAALGGFDIPVAEVALVDAVVVVYIVAEAIIDAFKR